MTDDGFERVLRSASHSRHYAPALRPLLRQVYFRSLEQPADLPALKTALEELLTFLSVPEGRTDANVCVTDYFFSSAGSWEGGWSHLPRELQQLLDSFGGTLHDAIYAPHIAANFESLPEQLLLRLRALG
jgi:hypothetical protein